MTSLTITRGLPGAGKTTWAKEWVTEGEKRARVNRDDIRRMLFINPDYSFEQEELVTDVQKRTIKTFLAECFDVIADDTNLPTKRCREWYRFAVANKVGFNVVNFEITVEESIARQAGRPEHEQVAWDVIRRMGRFLSKGSLQMPDYSLDTIEKGDREPYVPDESKPKAIIVDIDGTVAHMDGRDPHDLSKVHTDVADEAVVDLVQRMDRQGVQVIFLSGREETCREVTEEWLVDNVLPTAWLYTLMRPAGDKRKDAIVKYELFDKYVRESFSVLFVLDDRQQVVDMWREIGLKCLQVQPGDF